MDVKFITAPMNPVPCDPYPATRTLNHDTGFMIQVTGFMIQATGFMIQKR